MSYLKQRRSQLTLACLVLAAVLLSQFPEIDIRISRLFFDRGFPLRDQWWQPWMREATTCFLWVSMTSVVALYLFNRLSKRHWGGIDGRKVCYLFLVLILGAGLIVNVILKDNFGRARPRDIEEFGGSRQFTPAFVISRQCDANCSFSSGEAAGAFFSLALVMALSRRRALFVAGAAFGTVVSLYRVATGAHFFSDTVVSFFVMLIVADVLYYYMFVPEPAPVPAPAIQGSADYV